MSKQTPIEWLLTHMTAEGYIDEKELLNRDTALNELCRTAFEVEKNELKQTAEFWHGKDLSNPIFESYYDDTFNKKHIVEANEMIEVPQQEISDEEIEEMLFHHSNEYAIGFKDAIKWYREQLKSKQ